MNRDEALEMAEASADDANAPITHYPVGQTTMSRGGPGIFTDNDGERILVWIDVALKGRVKMIQRLLAEGAEIATQHWDPCVHLLIMSPASVKIFDMYCHPDYMRTTQYQRHMQGRRRRLAQGREPGEEIWTSKVMLKENWADQCFAAGRFLGEADNWAGFRAGGPLDPANGTTTLPIDLSKEALMDPPEIQVIPATQRTVSPISVLEDQDMDREGDVTEEPPRPDTESAKAGDVEATPKRQRHPGHAIDVDSYDTPSRPFAITDSVPMERDESGSGFQAMEIDPPSSPPEAALPTASTTEAKPPDGSPGKADHKRNGATPRAGPPSSPVTLMRERNGELEIAPYEDSEEEEEMVEERTPRQHQPEALQTAPVVPVIPAVDQATPDVPSMDVDEEDEVERNMAMELDDGMDGADGADDVADGSLPQEVPQASPKPSVAPPQEQESIQFSSQVSMEPEPLHVEDANAEAGPSTPRFQSPRPVDDPSKLFEGYRFWVDLKRPDRGDLIKRIRAARGQLVMTYDQATHVLVHDRKSPMWPSIIKDVVKRGVWFMDFKWILKCLHDGIQYPELGDHLDGGAPILLTQVAWPSHRPRKRDRTSESGSQATPTGQWIKQSPSSSSRPVVPPLTGAAPHDADEIARLFQLAHDESNGQVSQVVKRMQETLPGKGYSDAKLSGLYNRWRKRTGRFAHILHVQPSLDEMLPVLKRLGQQAKVGELRRSKALHELHDAFPSAFSSHKGWASIWTEYQTQSGRFTLKDHPTQSSPALASSSSQSQVQRPSPPESSPASSSTHLKAKRGSSWLSSEELSAIFEREFPKYLRGEQTNTQLAEALCQAYGRYSLGTWKQYLMTWRTGTGKFEGFGSRPLRSGAASPKKLASAADPEVLSGSQRPAQNDRRLTDEDMGRIFASFLPSLEKYQSVSRLGAEIFKTYTQYAAGTWGVYFNDWRHGKNRFAQHGKEYMNPDRPVTLPTAAANHASTSKHTQGVKEEDSQSSTPIAAESPLPNRAFQRGQPYTQEDIRGMAQYVIDRLPRRTTSGESTWFDFAIMYSGRTPGAWSQKYHSQGHKIHAVARQVATERGKVVEYESVYPELYPKTDGVSNASASQVPGSVSQTTVAPAHTASAKAATSTDRSGQAYTEEEKRMMAKYIVRRLPARTRDNSIDWREFADEHPERTFGAWTQKGSDHQVHVYAREIAVERGKLAQFEKAYPRLARVLEPSEPVDVTEIDSDSDDPDFVDKTGIDSD